MKTTKIRYIHDMAIRYDRPIGNVRTWVFAPQRRTVAMRGREDGSIEVSIAWCPAHKNFSRRIGRDISSGRLTCNRATYDRTRYVTVIRDGESLPKRVGNSVEITDGLAERSNELQHLYALVKRDLEMPVFTNA